MSLTYTLLLTAIQGQLDRFKTGDTVAVNQANALINQAERRITTDLQIQGFERTLTKTLAQGVNIVAKPDRWKRTVSLTVSGNGEFKVLYPRSYEYLRAVWNAGSLQDTPICYADHGSANWLIAPTPDYAYALEAKVMQMPLPLTAGSNETNWLTEEMPDLLNDAAMLECAIFVKNKEQIGLWSGRYEKTKGAYQGLDIKKIMDRAAAREGA